MTIFYARHTGKPDFYVDLSKINATAGYLRHYENYLTLGFIQRTTTNRVEKQQATEELAICERKMAWMANHKNYDHAEALKGIETLKRHWRTAA